MRNLIRQAAPILGGQFYTHQYLHGRNSWLDLYFLGHKAPTFYNATLQTSRDAYHAAVEKAALDRSYELAPDAEPSRWKAAIKDPWTGLFVVSASEPRSYPELDGLTRSAWVDREMRLIADAHTVQLFERWELQDDYAHGLGLHVTLNVEYLNVEVINTFIQRFMEAPGQSYCDSTPLTYGFDDIRDWGVNSNAICEPWDYPIQPDFKTMLRAMPSGDDDLLQRDRSIGRAVYP